MKSFEVHRCARLLALSDAFDWNLDPAAFIPQNRRTIQGSRHDPHSTALCGPIIGPHAVHVEFTKNRELTERQDVG